MISSEPPLQPAPLYSMKYVENDPVRVWKPIVDKKIWLENIFLTYLNIFWKY